MITFIIIIVIIIELRMGVRGQLRAVSVFFLIVLSLLFLNIKYRLCRYVIFLSSDS